MYRSRAGIFERRDCIIADPGGGGYIFSRDPIIFSARSLSPLPKTMAKTTMKAERSGQTKKSKSVVGAPSQLSQNTRRGKKAWRKNIDIDNVEEGLETIRTEERVLGTALHNQPDKDLFAIDTAGDEGGACSVTMSELLANRPRPQLDGGYQSSQRLN